MKRIATFLLIYLLVGITAKAQETHVLIKTSLGDITVMLYDDTPLHRENFKALVNNRFYDDLIFHRVINEFMIQTGNPNTKNHQQGASYQDESFGETIPAEFKPDHIHKKGALAAARMPDQVNPRKESSGSQFYIVQGKTWPDNLMNNFNQKRPVPYTEEQLKIYREIGGYPPLDLEYTVFGEVIDGFDVIDRIAAVQTVDPARRDNRPVEDVRIISARVIKKKI